MENWRGFQIVNEVTSMKEANILVETRTMRLTLEELDRSYKDKKISRRSYQNTLKESIAYDIKKVESYLASEVLKEEKWDDEGDEEYVPKKKDPNSLMSRIGKGLASGWLKIKTAIMGMVFKMFKLIGTSKDGHLNFIGKAAKKVVKMNDRFKKDHPFIHGAIKALIILALTLALSHAIAGMAGLDAAAERVGRTAVKGGIGGLQPTPEMKEGAQILQSIEGAPDHPVINACAAGQSIDHEQLASLPDHVDKVSNQAVTAAEGAEIKADVAKEATRETKTKLTKAVAKHAASPEALDAKRSAAGKVGKAALDTKVAAATDAKVAAGAEVKKAAAAEIKGKLAGGEFGSPTMDAASGRTIKITLGSGKEFWVTPEENALYDKALGKVTGTAGMKDTLASMKGGKLPGGEAGMRARADTAFGDLDADTAADTASTKGSAVAATAAKGVGAKGEIAAAAADKKAAAVDSLGAKKDAVKGAAGADTGAAGEEIPDKATATKNFNDTMTAFNTDSAKNLSMDKLIKMMPGKEQLAAKGLDLSKQGALGMNQEAWYVQQLLDDNPKMMARLVKIAATDNETMARKLAAAMYSSLGADHFGPQSVDYHINKLTSALMKAGTKIIPAMHPMKMASH